MCDNASSNNPVSLIKFLEEKIVIIPFLQRDYAQGRDNKETEVIRTMFVDAICNSIIKNEPLSLDFTYGEKKSDEKRYYPVDGQQRLLTLFLVCAWVYRNLKSDKKSKEKRDGLYKALMNFHFEARHEASVYLKALLDDSVPDSSLISPEIWHKSPSAEGMARTYALINEKLSNQNVETGNLIDNLNNITFFEISGDLPSDVFIKMNARGRKLTESEILNAGIIGQIGEKKTFKYAFLHFYEAVFWDIIDIRKNEDVSNDSIIQTVDNVIMRVVKSYCRWLTKGDDYKFNDFILPEKYWEALGKDEAYKNLQKFFVFYTNGESFKKFLPERKRNIQEKKHLFESLNEKLIASAITFFGKDADDRSFSSWMRISANLIDNSCSDKNLKKIINLLSEYSSDIESYLSSKNVSYFLDRLEVEEKNHINTLEQLEEEIKKIKLIESDSNWKSAIERAENKEILNGKVSILWCDGGDKDIERFNANLSSLIELWDKQNTEKREYTFSKTLLSYYKSNLPEMRIDMKCSKPSEAKDVIYNSLNGCFEEFIKSNTEGMASEILYENKYWIKCICDTDILKYNRDTGRYISTYWGKYAILWGTNGCTWNSYGNILFSKRYEMLATLIDRNLVNLLNDNQRVGNTACFNDGSVYFEYSGHIFQFWWAPGPNEHDIYLMRGDRNKVDGYMVRPGRDEKENVNDYEKYYCLSFEADDIDKEVNNVLKGMIRLIDIAS